MAVLFGSAEAKQVLEADAKLRKLQAELDEIEDNQFKTWAEKAAYHRAEYDDLQKDARFIRREAEKIEERAQKEYELYLDAKKRADLVEQETGKVLRAGNG